MKEQWKLAATASLNIAIVIASSILLYNLGGSVLVCAAFAYAALATMLQYKFSRQGTELVERAPEP